MQDQVDVVQEINLKSPEIADENSEIADLSRATQEILNPKEDPSENCTSLGLDIVFYTDEGQIFELTPFVDVTSIVLEEKIVDPSLKTAASSFSFSVSGLSEEFLNFLFFRNEDIFVKVSDNNKPVFRGILEKFFSRDLFNSTKSVSFTVNDYSSLLKIAFENPVQFPINFSPDWLFVYNPLAKELSLVHLIIEKTKLKDLIDDDARSNT